MPFFAEYERTTAREIPVVVLVRDGGRKTEDGGNG
jgi:hypothetical protein